jgi:hypothetical protein
MFNKLTIGIFMTAHLRSMNEGFIMEFKGLIYFLGGKAFQNLSVSSPAPVTSVYPSGLQER